MIVEPAVELEIYLNGATTTNEPTWYASWSEYNDSTGSLSPFISKGKTEGTTKKQIMQAGTLPCRLQQLLVHNGDTVAATVNLRLKYSAAESYVVYVAALPANGQLIYTRGEGWRIVTPTSHVIFGAYQFDTDQSVGAGQDNYVLTYDNATGVISLEAAPGAGGGETNTASNLGAGVGVYETKSGVDLQFNSLVSQTTALTISEDDPNNEIDFTIADVIAAGASGLMSGSDKTKLDGIEALADVTDTTNVTAAGALMDSEVDANIKTLVLPASTTISAFGASLVDDADAATARTTLGLVIGTNVQAWDTDLDTWAGKTAPTGTVVGTTDTQTITNKDLTDETNKLRFSKAITVEAPADGDRIPIFMNERAITILGVSFASEGGTSVLFNLEYATTIASGTVIHTDTCATSTPEWDVTPSGTTSIATDQIICLEITTVTGTVNWLTITIEYDET